MTGKILDREVVVRLAWTVRVAHGVGTPPRLAYTQGEM